MSGKRTRLRLLPSVLLSIEKQLSSFLRFCHFWPKKCWRLDSSAERQALKAAD
jgi:hypothetical protein